MPKGGYLLQYLPSEEFIGNYTPKSEDEYLLDSVVMSFLMAANNGFMRFSLRTYLNVRLRFGSHNPLFSLHP